MDDDTVFRPVAPGEEARRLVEAVLAAEIGADLIRADLADTGEDTEVVPTWDRTGKPMVRIRTVPSHQDAAVRPEEEARPPPEPG